MDHRNDNIESWESETTVDLGGTRHKPDGARDPAGEAGWFLQRERESRGLSLEEAGDLVGVHPYHLQAIELGDMRGMPPRAEALEMIGAYADFLGFEPEPLVRHYVSFLPRPQVAPRSHPAAPAPMSSAKILTFGKFVKLPPINFRLPTSGNGGIVASLAAAVLLASGITWTVMQDSAPSGLSQQVAQVETDPMPTATTGPGVASVKISEQGMEPSDQPVLQDPAATADITTSDSASPAAGAGLDPDVMAAFIQKNVPGGDTAAPAPTAEVAAIPGIKVDTADSAPLPQQHAALENPEGRVFGDSNPNVHLVLKANRAIWLLIEDNKGNRVATQLLNKGDIYRVPDREGLVATVQDGGAISFIIDGEEKGVLGQPGSVLAAEPLDIRKLQSKG